MGRSQSAGPILVPLNIRCRKISYNQKGPIALRISHIVACDVKGPRGQVDVVSILITPYMYYRLNSLGLGVCGLRFRFACGLKGYLGTTIGEGVQSICPFLQPQNCRSL